MLSTVMFFAVVAGTIFHSDATGTFLNTGATFSKCDDSIILKINSNWAEDPEDVFFKTAISLNETFVVKATSKGCLTPDVSCTTLRLSASAGISASVGAKVGISADASVGTKVSGGVSVSLFVHEKLKTGKVIEDTLNVIVTEGVIVDLAQSLTVYNVFSENNVIGCYVCLLSDKASVGPPASFVAVGADGFDVADFKSAVKVMASVGLDCTVPYPETCL